MSERMRKWVTAGLMACLFGMSVLYVTATHRRDEYQNLLEGAYSKSYFDLMGNLQNIEVNLSKVMLANTPAAKKKYYTLISRQAELAETNLSQLPMENSTVDRTMKYVNQLGDYASYLAQQGETPVEGAEENLAALKATGQKLNAALKVLGGRIAEGHNQFTVELLKEGEPRDNSIAHNLARIQETNIEYPKLIYDGPFSENSITAKPKTDFPLITAKDAAARAGELFEGEIKAGDSVEGSIPTYGFTLERGQRQAALQMTQKGGYILWLLDAYAPKETRLSLADCEEKAIAFARQAYGDMTVVWAQEVEHVGIINLTPRMGDTVIYPDMVKVQIAMDTGEVIGVEGSSYVKNHHAREMKTPALTVKQAEKEVNPRFDVRKKALALIPTQEGEKLCYEFQGFLGEEYFILYVNGDNGQEEEMFRVLDISGTQMLV